MKNIVEVHVVPIWDAYDRALEPIREHRPDVVYLLEDENIERPAAYDQLRRELAAEVRDLEIGRLDLFDMYDVMGFVTTIADDHAGDTVRVNVSAGTTQSAIGATMACMDDETDAEPYLVNAAEPTPGTRSTDVPLAAAAGLDVFPIDSPTRDQLVALAVIEACNTASRETKLKTLLDYGEEYGIECLQGTEGKGRYNKLRNNITDFLETKGYVRTTQVSSQAKHIEVTETGLQTLRAFRHRVEDVIGELEASRDERVEFELDHPIETLEPWEPDGREPRAPH